MGRKIEILKKILRKLGPNIESGQNSISPDYVIKVNESISFKGTTYGSVGYDYKLEFDQTAFEDRTTYKELYVPRKEDYYVNPRTGKVEFHAPCGSDEIEETHVLSAQKRGLFLIREIVIFRGDVDSEQEHWVLVK